MIGDRHAFGMQGYTILEEGEINRTTFQLDVHHYLVCRPNGEALDQRFVDIEAAQAAIRALENQSAG